MLVALVEAFKKKTQRLLLFLLKLKGGINKKQYTNVETNLPFQGTYLAV
jgi:hypothetical protein